MEEVRDKIRLILMDVGQAGEGSYDEYTADADRIMALKTKKEPVAEVPCSAGLVAKLIEIDSLIRCVHLDMGGNDKYHISPRHNDQIGTLIKECLYIAEGT